MNVSVYVHMLAQVQPFLFKPVPNCPLLLSGTILQYSLTPHICIMAVVLVVIA